MTVPQVDQAVVAHPCPVGEAEVVDQHPEVAAVAEDHLLGEAEVAAEEVDLHPFLAGVAAVEGAVLHPCPGVAEGEVAEDQLHREASQVAPQSVRPTPAPGSQQCLAGSAITNHNALM